MSRHTPILAAPLLAALSMLIAGCPDDRPGETTLERVQRTGTIRIAYANEAPFGYRDTETGRVTGEAPEVARAILARMGVDNIETTLTDFGQLIPGLQAGRFDLIAAGMYITPLRCRQIAFSNPTYGVGEAFLVAQGNPRSLHSYEDVRDNPDARLGVVAGTVELDIAQDVGIPSGRVEIFSDNSAALAGLRAGRIDAFGGTELTVEDLIERTGGEGVERADPFEQPDVNGRTRSYGAFGFRHEDEELREAFNDHLAQFIGSEEHLALVEPFGFTEQFLPGDITAEELCAAE